MTAQVAAATAPDAESSGLSSPLFWVSLVMLCGTVCALSLGLYDVYVRQPRTPRLAVVDIAKLFAAAERSAKDGVVAPATPGAAVNASAADPQGLAGSPSADLLAAARTAENFGPSVERVLGEISAECQCAIVAMAAVIGGSTTVPDYTQEAARRLGLMLRAAGMPDRARPGR